MINSKTPNSAVVERMGSDSAVLSATSPRSVYARQLCAVAERVFFTCNTGDDSWQLPIARKKLARAVRLLKPKTEFLRSNVTFLSKEFQGENR